MHSFLIKALEVIWSCFLQRSSGPEQSMSRPSVFSHWHLNSHFICCPTFKAYKNLNGLNQEQISLHKIKNIYLVVKEGQGVKKVLLYLYAWLRSNKTLPIFWKGKPNRKHDKTCVRQFSFWSVAPESTESSIVSKRVWRSSNMMDMREENWRQDGNS